MFLALSRHSTTVPNHPPRSNRADQAIGSLARTEQRKLEPRVVAQIYESGGITEDQVRDLMADLEQTIDIERLEEAGGYP